MTKESKSMDEETELCAWYRYNCEIECDGARRGRTARRARDNKDKKIRKEGDDDDASGKFGVCFDLEA